MRKLAVCIVAGGLAVAGLGVLAPGAQANDDCDGTFTENGNVLRFGPAQTTFFSGGDWEGVHDDEYTDAWVEYRGWTNVNQAVNAIAEGDVEGAVTPDDGYPVTVEAGTGQGITYCSNATLDDARDLVPLPSDPSGDCRTGDADAVSATPIPGVTVGLLAPNGTTGVYDDNTGASVETYGWVDAAAALEAIIVDGDPEGAVEPDDESYPATLEADTGQGTTYCSNGTLDDAQNLP